MHTGRAIDWKEFEACLEPLLKEANRGIPNAEIHSACEHHINIADGASNVFYLYLGWIPAGAYVGFFELIWRIKYRKKIRSMGGSYKGRWFSNLGIALSIPVWMYVSLLLYLLVNLIISI